MITELGEAHELFRKAEVMINEITRPVALKYGMTEEILSQITAELINQHKEAEQGKAGQPPLAALSKTSPVI